MHPDKQQFLNLKTPPARLTPEQAAWFLGFEVHDIPVLIRQKLLKPLGNPPANGTKHFAAVELERLRTDPRWLARATDAIHHHWQKKNTTKVAVPPSRIQNLAPAAVASSGG